MARPHERIIEREVIPPGYIPAPPSSGAEEAPRRESASMPDFDFGSTKSTESEPDFDFGAREDSTPKNDDDGGFDLGSNDDSKKDDGWG